MYGGSEALNHSSEAVAAPEMIDNSAIESIMAEIEAGLDVDSLA